MLIYREEATCFKGKSRNFGSG